MSLLKASLFDFDDTLMATSNTRFSALIKAAGDFGFHTTREDIARHWGKPFDELVAGIAPGVDYDAFRRHYAEVMRGTPAVVLPGARRLLAELASRSVPVLVLSSGSRELVKQDLTEGDLLKYIAELWCYEDTTHHKPDPRTLQPVLRRLEELKILTNEVVYIADSVSDFRVALANRIMFYAVLSGIDSTNDFRAVGLGDDSILESLEELLDSKSLLMRSLPPRG